MSDTNDPNAPKPEQRHAIRIDGAVKGLTIDGFTVIGAGFMHITSQSYIEDADTRNIKVKINIDDEKLRHAINELVNFKSQGADKKAGLEKALSLLGSAADIIAIGELVSKIWSS